MSEPEQLYVLLAPEGQLCGNGQLRESIDERRARRGADYKMWYLPPELVQKFGLDEDPRIEAVVAADSSSIAWLKLRFGGERKTAELDISQLWEHASAPPKKEKGKDIGRKKN